MQAEQPLHSHQVFAVSCAAKDLLHFPVKGVRIRVRQNDLEAVMTFEPS